MHQYLVIEWGPRAVDAGYLERARSCLFRRKTDRRKSKQRAVRVRLIVEPAGDGRSMRTRILYSWICWFSIQSGVLGRRSIECASPARSRNQRTECQLPLQQRQQGAIRIEIERQLSKRPCIQRYSYGRLPNGNIWTSLGCHAVFRFRPVKQKTEVQYISCTSNKMRNSNKFQFKKCTLPTNHMVRDLQVGTQYSRTRCMRNKNYGTHGGFLWVKGGCSAEFKYYY